MGNPEIFESGMASIDYSIVKSSAWRVVEEAYFLLQSVWKPDS